MMDRPSESVSGNKEARELFDKANSIFRTEPDTAKELLRRSSELGCTASMVLLGDILIDGDENDKKEAIRLFERAHEMGNNMGSRNLGYCYALGMGVEQDKRKAAEWYTTSAEAGNAKAQCNIGVLYEYGHGVEKDYGKAAEWFRISAENGYHRGRTNYACCLRDGKGVERDPEKAAYWFGQSGSARATRLLALMYLSGDGIEKDIPKARELLESASGKDRKAMFHLGNMIFDEDRERAISLFRKSAERGFDDAIKRLEELGLEVPQNRNKF